MDMSTNAANAADAPVHSANMRLVVVDDRRQPRYMARAASLEDALLGVITEHGLDAADVPGLHGMCVEAMRSAERHGR